jgi:Flp pilus assembly protein TadD
MRTGFAPRAIGWGGLLLLAACTGCSAVSHVQNAEGVRHYQGGDLSGAIRQFDEALANNPRNANAYYNLAATYHQVGKSSGEARYLDQAEGYYRQSLQLDPDHRDCYRNLAVLMVERGRPEEGFALLRGWGTKSVTSAAPHIELARLYEEFGDIEEAEKQLVEAITLEPNNSFALAAKARLDEMEGDYQQAMVNYQRSYRGNRRSDVAQRIAALQTATGPAQYFGRPGDTRLATEPSVVPR